VAQSGEERSLPYLAGLLRCVAVLLRCVAVWQKKLVAMILQANFLETHCNTLQHAATHCNTLQHISHTKMNDAGPSTQMSPVSSAAFAENNLHDKSN